MKTSSTLGYGEAESLMTDTLAAGHPRVCRLSFGPTCLPPNRAGLFTRAFFPIFAPLEQFTPSSRGKEQKERYKRLHSHARLRCVSSAAGRGCRCELPGLGLGRASTHPQLQAAPGAPLRRPSLWHDRRYRKAELHKPEQFKVQKTTPSWSCLPQADKHVQAAHTIV